MYLVFRIPKQNKSIREKEKYFSTRQAQISLAYLAACTYIYVYTFDRAQAEDKVFPVEFNSLAATNRFGIPGVPADLR